ncbi:hypothetical protein A3A93_01895 [Candidatus Roizmanbacteria bacterium RIFCSPLOWO2_01_FULL_38_12]|uniref:DNA recombination protein RmuC n=1 Tax=Candidatus Roizmanbacteria bacterium RIFCSPLOWO2_01_FULL_38_12 TaxID=1802061 RepID=A0A1F7IXZ4_9BACT|nr:MAG: hypothetical protein A2861_01415 [Candidatus Roizmanbacteria bacterium RIFCSPHIGHO2_01_FULL_38_15]OGK35278.1 MAG: hypothetical protein A3F59_02820 [Candidatus Roizmanbacteria bacterium RIFCSPHIGHO2_12_FULL_38_13]OGK48204.1 MAG: hypothetical protein A3A93_01895 [Candidatus Roizmanbacteria bacterium RIFCSPLOWO2_01_FULL_38_12]
MINYLPYIFTTVVIVAVLLTIRFWLNSLEKKSNVSEELMSWLKDVSESNRQVDRKLTQNMDMFNKRLDKAAEVISGVQKSIGEFSEIGRSMQELQEFLQSPKLRGNIGEQVLKELLSQSLPPDIYKLQYSFKNGQTVDAIIKTSQGLIPIDSKFPISNFKNMINENDKDKKEKIKKEFMTDVKKHMKSISQKYILTSEGTIDYALMYVPSESVYYEIINSVGLYDYAAQQKIVPVSPLSFYAYLKVILISFEGQRIQSQAKEILAIIKSMEKDYEKTDSALSLLSKHVNNAYNQTSEVNRHLNSIGQKIQSTSTIKLPENEKKELKESG